MPVLELPILVIAAAAAFALILFAAGIARKNLAAVIGSAALVVTSASFALFSFMLS